MTSERSVRAVRASSDAGRPDARRSTQNEALMARPAHGTIVQRATRQGDSFALRISFNGRKYRIVLGGSWDGWTLERAEKEREFISHQIARGEWVPPARPIDQALERRRDDESEMTFQVFASVFLAKKKSRLSPKGYVDLKWRLETAMDHFGEHPITAIDVALIDDFVTGALRERAEIEQAAAAGEPLREEAVNPRSGRTYLRRRRGLSRSSINKVVVSVRMVLKDAVRRKLLTHNPAADPDCLLRVPAPSRSYLEAEQLKALLEAAREAENDHRGLTWQQVRYIRESSDSGVALAPGLGVSDVLVGKVRRGELWVDKSAARSHNDVPRLAPVAVLALAGLRIGELCGLRGEHIDLAHRRIRITRDITKTDAGERVIPMTPLLREILIAHRASWAFAAHEPVFQTRTGRPQSADNIRSRILAPLRIAANERLLEQGLVPISHLTPHTLRRTFASLALVETQGNLKQVMRWLGHSNPKLTMSVYVQLLELSDADYEAFGTGVDALIGDLAMSPSAAAQPAG